MNLSNLDSNKKREIIMDHYLNPKNICLNNDQNFCFYFHSNSCSDEMWLFQNDFNFPFDFSFKATGCAIFISSIDLTLNKIKKYKSKEEVIKLLKTYLKLINNEEALNSDELDLIDNLIVFQNVKKHLNRFDCAKSIFDILNNFLKLNL